MSVIDTRLIVLLLVAAAMVALGVSLLLTPVRDSESGETAARMPGWARPLGALVALLGLVAGCTVIWPGLDQTTAGVAMGISVLLFAVGVAYRRRTGLAGEHERPGVTPRPQLGILLTGTGIANAAMVMGVALAGRLI